MRKVYVIKITKEKFVSVKWSVFYSDHIHNTSKIKVTNYCKYQNEIT